MGWKVSWLLPIVLGFIIATIIAACLSIKSDQNKEQSQTSLNIVQEQPITIDNKDASIASASETISEGLTETEAYEFAQELFKKIDADEKLLKDAFELREYNTLSKYVSSDWIAYTDQPHRYYPKAQVTFGSKYFPESDTVSPYTSCDTAFRDLFIYANAMQNVVREDTATLRKILRQEKEDYDKSKARCKKRVDMTYQEAWEAEENE